jgi:hypothetical protein
LETQWGCLTWKLLPMLFDFRQCYEPSCVVDDLSWSQPLNITVNIPWSSQIFTFSHFFLIAPCCFMSYACSQLDLATWYASRILALFVLLVFQAWLCPVTCLYIHDSLHCICCELMEVSPLRCLYSEFWPHLFFFFTKSAFTLCDCGIIKAKINK